MRSRDIWKTTPKKIRKKNREFSTFLADSREKNHHPIKFKKKVNKHSEKWLPAAWKQLFIYPLGLMKTLWGIYVRRCFERYTGKDLCWSVFLIKFQVFSLQTLTQVFSCEIIKNTFFINHLGTTVSGRATLELYRKLSWVFHLAN